MKLKTLREKLAVTSYEHDEADVEIEFDLTELCYRGLKEEIRTLKVKRIKLSKKKLTLIAAEGK